MDSIFGVPVGTPGSSPLALVQTIKPLNGNVNVVDHIFGFAQGVAVTGIGTIPLQGAYFRNPNASASSAAQYFWYDKSNNSMMMGFYDYGTYFTPFGNCRVDYICLVGTAS